MKTKAIILLCFLCLSLCGCSPKSGVGDGAITGGVGESEYSSFTENGDCLQPDENEDNQTGESGHVCRFMQLTVLKQPDKTSYEEGTCFDGEGMILAFACECGNYETKTEYEVEYESGGKAFSLQDSSVIIRSGNHEIRVSVSVKEYGGGVWSEPMPLD